MADAETFDCFLSHNSQDKPAVRVLASDLRAAGLAVWLDEDQLFPGLPWQPLVESGIRASRSVAVLVGADGLGPWENEEMQAALNLAVRDKRSIIPVLLPGAPEAPALPLFLANRTWVDLRGAFERETQVGLDTLIWGITGKRPPRLSWQALAAWAETWEGFGLQRKVLPANFFADQKGLEFPPDPPAESYGIGEEVAVVLDLTGDDWARDISSDHEMGLVLLAEDLQGVSCLYPSRFKAAPLTAIRIGEQFRIPRTADGWMRISGPIGHQTLYAILTCKPLPKNSDLYRRLEAGVVDQFLLDRLARDLGRQESLNFRVFKYPYAAMNA